MYLLSPIDPSQGKASGIRPQNATPAPVKTNKSAEISNIRDQIKSGSYTVDFQKLANAILRSGELN